MDGPPSFCVPGAGARSLDVLRALESARHAQCVRAVPSVLHEALRELFTRRPDLLAGLLPRDLGLADEPLVAMATELTDPGVSQLLPDAVFATPSPEAPVAIVIVEVQLSVAAAKRKVWPLYAAVAYRRFGCTVEVVVVTPKADVARWASRPIRIGESYVMTPLVIGPRAIPLMSRMRSLRRRRWRC